MLRLLLFILLLIPALAHAQRKPIVKQTLTPTPGIERIQSLTSARDAAAQRRRYVLGSKQVWAVGDLQYNRDAQPCIC